MSARALRPAFLAAGLLAAALCLPACVREAAEGEAAGAEAAGAEAAEAPDAVVVPGSAPDPGDPASASYVFEGDTLLVAALAGLHVAAAQAELSAAPADSLRQAALAAHGLDEAAFAERLARATREPSDVGLLYDAVLHRLSLLRQRSP